MPMTIGQVASHAGVNIQTIRYYERRGLVPPPSRMPSGYRQYDRDTVQRLRFIKRAQELGFTLSEIQDLLALRVRHASACGRVAAKTREKITLVDEKIRELQRMKRGLDELVTSCEARRPTGDCPILKALDEGMEYAV
ncbi:MAG: MerR family transcriptional regulator [Gemmatimonadales bacterium]|nr:MerR family transcriptional regulator [Gemmatimonadales bacterium]NIN10850.1 MerR family transcriptional regulator [Gemmatimonadales bacterium]NIR02858.1 MerR family transcriptional regulator [Gemmatimonadales bacterium]NIS66492.1 MerR family transcriptional regulator [Gemmatimonadales bacterium]